MVKSENMSCSHSPKMIDAVVQHAMNKFVLYLFLYWKMNRRVERNDLCANEPQISVILVSKRRRFRSRFFGKNPPKITLEASRVLSETESTITYQYVWI